MKPPMRRVSCRSIPIRKTWTASSANLCTSTGKHCANPLKPTVCVTPRSPALMPSETSSQISNATNGIEPPRGHVSIKASKDGILRQVVPDYENLQNAYELLWEMPNNDGYLQLVGIMQKFIDQSISANTNYDPTRFPSGKCRCSSCSKTCSTPINSVSKRCTITTPVMAQKTLRMTWPRPSRTTAAKAALVRSRLFLPGGAMLTRPTIV